jgi:hypothetical protein
MLAEVNNLREIARRCLSGEPLDDGLSLWLGDSLRRFLDHRCHSVDEALGLHFSRGGIPWWREEAIRMRDAALRELALRFCGDLSVSAQARQVQLLSVRYGAAAWRFDRDHHSMPDFYAGTAKELLWRAFASGAPMPLCERRLREILAH